MKSAGNDIVALNAIDIQRTTSPAFYSKFITAEELALYNHAQFAAVPFQNFVWLLWSVKESAYKYLKRHQPDLIFSPSKIIVQNITAPHSEKSAAPCGSPLERGRVDCAAAGVCLAVWEGNNTGEGFYSGEVVLNISEKSAAKEKCGPVRFPPLGGAGRGFAKINSNDNADEAFYTGEILSGTNQLHFRSKITNGYIASIVNDNADFENVYWGIKMIDQSDHEYQSKQVREFLLAKLSGILNTDDLQIEKHNTSYPIILQGEAQLDIAVSLAHHGGFVAYSFLLS